MYLWYLSNKISWEKKRPVNQYDKNNDVIHLLVLKHKNRSPKRPTGDRKRVARRSCRHTWMCDSARMWREYDIKKLFIGEDPRAQRLYLRIKIPGAPKSKEDQISSRRAVGRTERRMVVSRHRVRCEARWGATHDSPKSNSQENRPARRLSSFIIPLISPIRTRVLRYTRGTYY